jgi:uracil-DNA glycosylase family 4
MLGEQPGQEEVRAGEGFVGRSGQEAEYSGVMRYNTFITNVRKCLGLTQETPEQRQATIQHCTAAYLAPEFERLKFARSLLCVGADALQQATGLTEMVKYHGSQWTKQEVEALRLCL